MLTILAEFDPHQWMNWFLHDETGQKAGIAIAVVGGLIALVVLFKTLRWMAGRADIILGLGVVVGGVYLLAVYLFKAGPVGWIAGGIVAFGMFLGLALFLTVAKR